jgi:hypothetical protein
VYNRLETSYNRLNGEVISCENQRDVMSTDVNFQGDNSVFTIVTIFNQLLTSFEVDDSRKYNIPANQIYEA